MNASSRKRCNDGGSIGKAKVWVELRCWYKLTVRDPIVVLEFVVGAKVSNLNRPQGSTSIVMR